MSRRKKRRVSPAPLICLLAVLACIVALRISVSEETAASAQMTGKLENPATTAPARLLEAEMTEAEQVTRAEDRPARAARYVNIEMTDEELAELAAVVFLEAGNQSAEGQQAVVEVVFNRVLHSAFPDSVHDVLHQGEDGDVPSSPPSTRSAPRRRRKRSMTPSTALCMETRSLTPTWFFSPAMERTTVYGGRSEITSSAANTSGGNEHDAKEISASLRHHRRARLPPGPRNCRRQRL